MARIYKDGYKKEWVKEKRDIYGIAYTQNMLSGRWKCLILWFLKTKKHRYNEIKAFLCDISQGSLTKQLRELEADGLIKRTVYPEVPPRVEYSLTPKGEEFMPILDLMKDFGKKHGERIDQ
ncbi:winged helix-turn-helix transcriptional regulator [Paenibacillus sp. SAF-054]|uniref:winged helix-turn-helix transcriptional regulator n=1 Tax=unclassified Paenibacillus TaxID=185978 RepID=UPI003F8156CE